MSIQPQRVTLSIASPSEIERTARQLMTIRENFLSTGDLVSWTPRPLIFDSWQRCRSLQVNPSRRAAPLAVARETQLEQLRESNELLRRAAQPVMKRLIDFLADSGYVVVLSDARGRLLEVVGDVSIRRRLARIDFVPGGNWSEAAAGTNAIGTALADGHVVQLMAAEHYCDGWQDLTCTASPIHHPLTNEVIGVLDLTGDYHLIRPFLTSLIAAAALEIRQRLQMLLSSLPYDEWQRHYHSLLMSLPSVAEVPRCDSTPMVELKNEQMGYEMPMVDIQWQLNRQERRAQEAELLATAAGVISASLDLDVTLEKVVEQVVHLLRVDRAGVALFDDDDEIASLFVWSALRPLEQEQLRVQVTLLKEARAVALIRERGEPISIDDAAHSVFIPARFVEQTGIRAMLLLPLVTARGVTGFIAASMFTPRPWEVEDIRLGLAIATHSATAIENARLFVALQQHNRHIETLNAIAQILNTLPHPGDHLDIVLQRMAEITHADVGIIFLLNLSDHDLTPATHYRLAERIQLDLETFPLRTLHMLARHVMTLREPIMVNVDECDEPLVSQSIRLVGCYSLIAVPLATSDAILGVLIVGSRERTGVTRADLKFFSTVGQQLGLSLRNAQLRRSASEMEALREADRLKSGFLAAVSHDLRSPLTAIRTSVESLLDVDGVQSRTGQEQLLRNIAGQAHRLGQLVDQLLDLSKIEAGALPLDCDWVELSVLIEDALKEFERLHADCSIERAVEPELPLHYLDPDRIVQVLWNLLENAYQYTPHGSPIRVEAYLADGEVIIRVADQGPGIPKGEHERVFQRFYRLDREQRSHPKGSGLGLAICKGIVEAHGGRIWVEDRRGGGCVFVVALRPPTPGSENFESSEEQALFV